MEITRVSENQNSLDLERDYFDRQYCSKFERHLLHSFLHFPRTKRAVLMDMFPETS